MSTVYPEELRQRERRAGACCAVSLLFSVASWFEPSPTPALVWSVIALLLTAQTWRVGRKAPSS
jgi:hypothetical protein